LLRHKTQIYYTVICYSYFHHLSCNIHSRNRKKPAVKRNVNPAKNSPLNCP